MDANEIRARLSANKLTFVWLIDRLSHRGIETDKTEISSVFAGTRKGAKADLILKESESIVKSYEMRIGN